VNIRINETPTTVTVPLSEPLLRTLRDRLGLCSVRATCGIGVCGSCTVLLDGLPVSSCLLLTVMAQARDITTAEGLGGAAPQSRVQDAFVREHAFQCSFCIPAMTLALHAVLQEDPGASEDTVKDRLSGNLCRCGTYPQILAVARELRQPPADSGPTT
jgi:aerobic-type carbon monoxide dehydrogenase small subunit (CoxS/CutS family)